MPYFILVVLALLPSSIWLLFYLRKDSHPESNWMVVKIFFYGLLSALPAALIEMGIFETSSRLNFPSVLLIIFNIFIGLALVEELLKYLVVREKVLKHSEFDEPIDAMLYMIIAGLGFAALENILVLFQIGPALLAELLQKALVISALRFVGATFLHALVSGVLGYFLALSFFETKKQARLLLTGLVTASVLHGLYNFSIIRLPDNVRLIIPAIILIALGFFVSQGFGKLKKMTSICKVK